MSDGLVVGIESKLSEWLTRKPKKQEPFKSKYFDSAAGRWSALGLPSAQKIAEDIYAGETHFEYLDAPQLLKHALGLATQFGQAISLAYVYLDWPGPESVRHKAELTRFSSALDKGLRFRVRTYNEIINSLTIEGATDRDYLRYLRQRYLISA